MKVAIFGASGMLGSMLVDYLSRQFEVTPLTRGDMDIANFNRCELAEIVEDHDWIINAAGVIPQRSTESKLMMQVNALFPSLLACFEKPVIQIATDCVFSGQYGEYFESDPPDCESAYGVSKRMGEIALPNFYNLRCSILGLEPHGNYSLLRWLLSQPQGATVQGYTGHLWNGITTLQFAKLCAAIIHYDLREIPNLQHIVPADYASKYRLLKIAADIFGRGDIKIEPTAKGGIVDRRLATMRPDLNRKLWALAGYPKPPHINEMLRELVEYKSEVKAH